MGGPGLKPAGICSADVPLSKTLKHFELQECCSAAGLQGKIKCYYATRIQLNMISKQNESIFELPFNLIGLKLLLDKYCLCNNQFVISKVWLLCDRPGPTSDTQSLLSFMSSDLVSDLYWRMHHMHLLIISHMSLFSLFKSTDYLKMLNYLNIFQHDNLLKNMTCM